jgi:cystathionine beta-lyase/cystathionine gamma-synthase
MDSATSSPVVPIYRTSAFAFGSVGEMAETFSGQRDRYIYTRYGNPTLAVAEERLAALEEAEGAVSFASGMAAIMASLMSVAGAGDHVVAQEDLYGGTTRLLERVLRRMGVEVTFAPTAEVADLDRFLKPNTRAVYLETPTNPVLRIVDLEAAAARARKVGGHVLVDNTFATPINQRPLDLGAALVIHSATKFLAGHGDLIAGVVAASGEGLRRLRELRKETGAILDVEAGWLLARSLKTLPLRVEAQNRNALEIAGHLAGRPDVAVVHYPGLPSHPGHDLARRQMDGFGGLLSFELKGGAVAAGRFSEALELIPLIPTLGGVETSIVIPALSSHSMISEEARRRTGVTEGLIRLSVGIEDAGDLIAEIDTALDRAS